MLYLLPNTKQLYWKIINILNKLSLLTQLIYYTVITNKLNAYCTKVIPLL